MSTSGDVASELRALVRRYAQTIDRRTFDELSSVFTEDARLDTGRAVRNGLDEICAAMEGLRRYESTEHRVGTITVDVEPQMTTATGSVSCDAHHVGLIDGRRTDRVMRIEYHDRYRLTGAGWRIEARRLDLLGEDVVTLSD